MEDSGVYEAAIVGDWARVIATEKKLANLEILLGRGQRSVENGSVTFVVGRGPEDLRVSEDHMLGSRRLRKYIAEANRDSRVPSTAGTFRAGLFMNDKLLALGQAVARDKELEVTVSAVEAFAIRKNISKLRLEAEREREALELAARDEDLSLRDFERDLPRFDPQMTTVEIRPTL